MEIPCKGKATQIYEKLKSSLASIQKSEYGRYLEQVEFEDSALLATAKGSGFTARIHCEDAKVVVDLDLNFLLKPARGKIEGILKKRLTDALT